MVQNHTLGEQRLTCFQLLFVCIYLFVLFLCVLLKTYIFVDLSECVFLSFRAAKQAGIIALENIFLEYFSLRFEQPSHGSADILEWAAVQTSGRGGSQLSKWQSHIDCAVTVTRLTQSELHWCIHEHRRNMRSLSTDSLHYPSWPDMLTLSSSFST